MHSAKAPPASRWWEAACNSSKRDSLASGFASWKPHASSVMAASASAAMTGFCTFAISSVESNQEVRNRYYIDSMRGQKSTSMQGLRRVEHLRAPALHEQVQGLRRIEHLRAPAAKESVQGLRRVKHLRAPAAEDRVQGSTCLGYNSLHSGKRLRSNLVLWTFCARVRALVARSPQPASRTTQSAMPWQRGVPVRGPHWQR